MSDPSLSAEIAAAVDDAAALLIMLEEHGKDISALKATDRVREAAERVREMALAKIGNDWDHLKDRIHDLSNRFIRLQERHLTIVEGPPPPPTAPTPEKTR